MFRDNGSGERERAHEGLVGSASTKARFEQLNTTTMKMTE